MPGRARQEGETPTTTLGTITYAPTAPNTEPYGLAREGAIFEAADPNDITPVVGDLVLADYLPSSGQWIIVTIVA